MIRRIRNSLTAKIFLLTVSLLLAVSMITYGSVSLFLPSTYRHILGEDLRDVSQELEENLRQYDSVEQTFNLLELFAANNQASVTLLDEQGEIVFPQTATENSGDVFYEFQGEVGQAGEENLVISVGDSFQQAALTENGPSAQETYSVQIGGKPYTLLVAGTMQSVSQTMEILRQILPTVLIVIGLVSLLCALGASLYLTRPILRLSRVSRKMAELDFDETCPQSRGDEVGVLGRSLNELSGNLKRALTGLEEANRKLRQDIDRERSFFCRCVP